MHESMVVEQEKLDKSQQPDFDSVCYASTSYCMAMPLKTQLFCHITCKITFYAFHNG